MPGRKVRPMPRVTRPKLKRYFPDGKWYNRVVPLPGHGIVFVKNAKVATSTILLWLHRIHTGDHDCAPPGGGIHFDNALPTPDEVGRGNVAGMLDGNAYRFTFVRDPVQRVESAYVSKVVRAADGVLGRRVRIQKTLGLPEDRDQVPTFEQFVEALGRQKPINMDQHWRPQHLNLMHPLVEYDLIGHLETFDADLERIREATGLPDVPIKLRNNADRDGSLFDGRPDLLNRVREIYARDFELYGY